MTTAPGTVASLTESVLAGEFGPAPSELSVTSAFWLHHTTRLPGAGVTYRNYDPLLQVGESFGACSFDAGAASGRAEEGVLPPVRRARARERDAAIAGLLEIRPGSKVALIGVVNPPVDAIAERGGVCPPCDLNLRETASGLPVLLDRCLQQEIPLEVYAQTGSAVVRAFLGLYRYRRSQDVIGPL